jgi:nitrite reductase/ring-hydroxylating ferredoxin subunit
MFERIARPLAGLSGWIARVVDATYRVLGRPGKVLQDLLNGTWIGHALHPLLTDVVVGGATAAVLLLVLGWFGVDQLSVALAWILGLTCLAALATAASGLTDFKDTFGDEQNVAGLHGMINLVGTVGLVVAFVAALADSGTLLAVALLASYALLSIGAFIGGHLVFKFGSMVNYNAFAGGKRAKEFTRIAGAEEVPDGTPVKVMLGATALVVVRRGDVAYALKDTCSHAGTSLSTGRLEGETIVCPTHGSTFRLANGAVRHGPAASRQVAYRARVNNGGIEVQGPIG